MESDGESGWMAGLFVFINCPPSAKTDVLPQVICDMLVDDGVYKWYVYAPLRELSIDTPADTTDASDRAFCLLLGVATQDKAQDIELLHRDAKLKLVPGTNFGFMWVSVDKLPFSGRMAWQSWEDACPRLP